MSHPSFFCERERLFLRECSGAAGLRRGLHIPQGRGKAPPTAQASSAATFTNVYGWQKEQKRMALTKNHPQKCGMTYVPALLAYFSSTGAGSSKAGGMRPWRCAAAAFNCSTAAGGTQRPPSGVG